MAEKSIYVLPYLVDSGPNHRILCFKKVVGKWYRTGQVFKGGVLCDLGEWGKAGVYQKGFPLNPKQMTKKGIGKVCLSGGKGKADDTKNEGLREFYEETGMDLHDESKYAISVNNNIGGGSAACVYVGIADAVTFQDIKTLITENLHRADLYAKSISERGYRFVTAENLPPVYDNELEECQEMPRDEFIAACMAFEQSLGWYAECAEHIP